MTGAEFIARVLSTGSFLGFGIGDSPEAADSVLPLSYADDFTGRRNSRTLRRDYGLFEVTYGGDPDWVCQAISLEVHRLLHLPDLREEVHERLGVRFEPFTSWTDVQREYERIPGSGALEVIEGSPGYRILRKRSVGASVHVLDDPGAVRGEFPGHGDVWSLEIIPARFM
ncbi:hypothetical protein ABT189_23880 [Streptomyces sp900105755]|uniref:hypothetical protein n=1 Tax=Streptomyces sp. 900105755 TaxID=3154389 RepID=UPI003329CA19